MKWPKTMINARTPEMHKFLIICFLLVSSIPAAARDYNIAILGRQENLELAFEKVGFNVEHIDYDDFITPSSPLAQAFDCIVFVDSKPFPAQATPQLLEFLSQGRDIVTMAGHCFSEPIYRVHDDWLNADQLLSQSLQELGDIHHAIDLAELDTDQWKRDTDNFDNPSTISLEDAPRGKRLKIHIRNLTRWDTFAGPFAGAEAHNALVLGLQGSDNLEDIMVELRQQDNSRWIASVPLTNKPGKAVLLDADFTFLPDRSPADRGYPGDKPDFENTAVIQFGLVFDFSPKPKDDYIIYVDKVATAKISLPDGFGSALFDKHLPVFYDSDHHRYSQTDRIRTYPNQQIIRSKFDAPANLSGISAIGFPYVDQSQYFGLLELNDQFGRRRGFAAGVLIHYEGRYKGGNWLIFGVEDQQFYQTEIFTETVIETIQNLRCRTYAQQLKEAEKAQRAKFYERKTADLPAVYLDREKGSFVYDHGGDFFMVGANYIGSFDVKTSHANENFFLHKWQQDFKKARDAGINCMRVWVEGIDGRKARIDSIITLANKYEIYLLLMPTAHPRENVEDLAEMFAAIAKLAADEPVVIGYDLMNEPYVSTIGSIRFDGKPGPLLRHNIYERYAGKGLYDKDRVDLQAQSRIGWPPVPAWNSFEQARDLYAAFDMLNVFVHRFIPSQDYSSLYGLGSQIPSDDTISDFLDTVDLAFEKWIRRMNQTIRKYDPNSYITVGYDTALAALDANEHLDFVAHHLYQSPVSYENMLKAVGTFQRLAELCPGKPITLGEFGYSTKTKLLDGSYLDKHTAAMAEMVIYLYAYANGYDGAMSWMVSDWPVPIMDHSAPWISANRQKYESGFGLYYYDGTARGKAKPIVPAMKFLSDYIKLQQPPGTFELVPTDTPVGFGYHYNSPGAVLVGMKEYQSDRFSFSSENTVNLMIRITEQAIEVMSSGDAELQLSRDWLYELTGSRDFNINGTFASVLTSSQTYDFQLLQGQSVKLTPANNSTTH